MLPVALSWGSNARSRDPGGAGDVGAGSAQAQRLGLEGSRVEGKRAAGLGR